MVGVRGWVRVPGGGGTFVFPLGESPPVKYNQALPPSRSLFVMNGTCLEVPDYNLSTGCAGISTRAYGGGERMLIDWAGSTNVGMSDILGM